ncbi:hypothetical protein BGZ83_006918 [Gryganskiella cystojenkinii]|nr:hypothetical protein BGZ83_006918 [Gryganskiella cystojenkinii]
MFYNNVVLKKHQWDAERATKKEFRLVAKRLLEMVGGTPGAKRNNDNKVIIGIGLGEFGSNSRLSSLHTAFSAYFVQLARSLNYIVVGPYDKDGNYIWEMEESDQTIESMVARMDMKDMELPDLEPMEVEEESFKLGRRKRALM